MSEQGGTGSKRAARKPLREASVARRKLATTGAAFQRRELLHVLCCGREYLQLVASSGPIAQQRYTRGALRSRGDRFGSVGRAAPAASAAEEFCQAAPPPQPGAHRRAAIGQRPVGDLCDVRMSG